MSEVKPTDIRDPEYFHKVVDCQYACPAHTPVPEYIRLIAQERYDDAYMVNWESNVFRDGCMRRTGVLAIDDLMEILRVTDISWFHFAHFARSLTKPPK